MALRVKLLNVNAFASKAAHIVALMSETMKHRSHFTLISATVKTIKLGDKQKLTTRKNNEIQRMSVVTLSNQQRVQWVRKKL